MTDIDRWVLRSAIKYINEYVVRRSTGKESVDQHFSINLSGQSLSSSRMSDYVAGLLNEYPEVADKIIFEITETAAISNLEYAIGFIDQFSEMGVRFALDDFGSGVSSFSYLKNLKVDFLKIDGSFVKDMASDPVDFAMVRSINHIGHILNIRTIAEHVESEEVLASLREVGVDYVQGNWKHKPESLESVCMYKGGSDESFREKLS
jgi:EAL domain-containing protein (putative c-di-GMP-specific phosphodiesterase class I)